MQLSEKISYIKGLMEGLGIDDSNKEGKVLLAMSDLLEELCDAVQDMDDDLDQVYDELDAIDEDMDDLESVVYGDEDDDEEEDEDDDIMEYELTCPNCGTVSVVDEDTLFTEEVSCPKCGATFDLEFEESEEDEEKNDPSDEE